MSFFSPITERSLSVKTFFGSIYAILIIGSLTMILPCMIMLSGSTSSGIDSTYFNVFPKFLLSKDEFFRKWIEARYHYVNENYQQAWGDKDANFYDITLPELTEKDEQMLALWKEFRAEAEIPENLLFPAYVRNNARVAAYTNRDFRQYLKKKYGDVDAINAAAETYFPKFTAILPPPASMIGADTSNGKLIQIFAEYTKEIPDSRKIFWNVANYYNSVYLPNQFGYDISHYNARTGENYTDFSEIPLSTTYPGSGPIGDLWVEYVQKFIRPDIVGLTAQGEENFKQSNLSRSEFVRRISKPEDLQIENSVDALFRKWTTAKGIEDAYIPQKAIDKEIFLNETGFWRNVFLTQNYYYVADEILLYGRAISNTFILVLLMVGGALIVNPLAAYALSRYKLKQTYTILLFLLATIAFPAEVTMIPNFIQLKELGLLNTFGALVLPTLANGFSIFLLKGFFDSLPRELYEAAEIDGANEWQKFWGITMNLSKPILAVIALGAFTSAYGAFFFALILAPDPKMWTIMVYIYQMRANVDSGIVHASLVLTAVPTLLVFLMAQNVILRGIVVPTEK